MPGWSTSAVRAASPPSSRAQRAGASGSGNRSCGRRAEGRRHRAAVEDDGARAETFVTAHLLKAVQGWTDLGLGRFELCYLRDKEQREVDLLVIRDGKPWFVAEVKFRDESLSPALGYFQELVHAPFAFQVVVDAPFVAADCFARPLGPMVVPARTLLSQFM